MEFAPVRRADVYCYTDSVNLDSLKKYGSTTYIAFVIRLTNRRPRPNLINDIFIDSVSCSDGKLRLAHRHRDYYDDQFTYGLPLDSTCTRKSFRLNEEQRWRYWSPSNQQEHDLSDFSAKEPKTLYVNFIFTADTILDWASGKIRILDSQDDVIEKHFTCVREHDTLHFPVVGP